MASTFEDVEDISSCMEICDSYPSCQAAAFMDGKCALTSDSRLTNYPGIPEVAILLRGNFVGDSEPTPLRSEPLVESRTRQILRRATSSSVNAAAATVAVCPNNNGSYYTDDYGAKYYIQCSFTNTGTNTTSLVVQTFTTSVTATTTAVSIQPVLIAIYYVYAACEHINLHTACFYSSVYSDHNEPSDLYNFNYDLFVLSGHIYDSNNGASFCEGVFLSKLTLSRDYDRPNFRLDSDYHFCEQLYNNASLELWDHDNDTCLPATDTGTSTQPACYTATEIITSTLPASTTTLYSTYTTQVVSSYTTSYPVTYTTTASASTITSVSYSTTTELTTLYSTVVSTIIRNVTSTQTTLSVSTQPASTEFVTTTAFPPARTETTIFVETLTTTTTPPAFTTTYVSTVNQSIYVTYTSVQPASTAITTQYDTVTTSIPPETTTFEERIYVTQPASTTTQNNTVVSTYVSTYAVTSVQTTTYLYTTTVVSTYATTDTVTSIQPTTILSVYPTNITITYSVTTTSNNYYTQNVTYSQNITLPASTATLTETASLTQTLTTQQPASTHELTTTIAGPTSIIEETTTVSGPTQTLQETTTEPGPTVTATEQGSTYISTVDRVVYVTKTVSSLLVSYASNSSLLVTVSASSSVLSTLDATNASSTSANATLYPAFGTSSQVSSTVQALDSTVTSTGDTAAVSPSVQASSPATNGTFPASLPSSVTAPSNDSDLGSTRSTSSSAINISSTSTTAPPTSSLFSIRDHFSRRHAIIHSSQYDDFSHRQRITFQQISIDYSLHTTLRHHILHATLEHRHAIIGLVHLYAAIPRSYNIHRLKQQLNQSLDTTEHISCPPAHPVKNTSSSPSCHHQNTPLTAIRYTDPSSGSAYTVQCNQTYQGVVGASVYEPTAEDCISACSSNPKCQGVGYNTTSGVCDEYYGYEPASGSESNSVVFAQVQGRYARGQSGSASTITAISTVYVSASARDQQFIDPELQHYRHTTDILRRVGDVNLVRPSSQHICKRISNVSKTSNIIIWKLTATIVNERHSSIPRHRYFPQNDSDHHNISHKQHQLARHIHRQSLQFILNQPLRPHHAIRNFTNLLNSNSIKPIN
ncbi:hypothetical protein Tdes44962_MAKER07983 [Teratosphaeria destructans]|uniref:Apple domain-containing protein n=1 Tax=Teratosphaeria destructans TaxID=418781 RepID=A0A9W7SXX4_9PEZI|nr:hypothetical protein Tdes44962_MAKER07983 [Teratosphaeria destructans]